ncbi:efflux transporter outer membrane subunit [Altererythrobacter sp. CC-YST694]|uniref:efflux transporter outer membrane subunit n=1 Tax=Altererythrobacter sp. CC-YST694 TaxID=2755038 RepID=UPI001D01312A|nr:efflux transporter outer membrane subunit [Altererythrobacter sp. CC-YST694]MCB5425064.1 efflux transporter outer membrane subunit [Altererythrobacter sp. CC-YST694]
MRYSNRYLILPALLSLGACTVGPNYAGPPALGSASGGDGYVRGVSDFAQAEPALADWWTALGDPVLDELEKRALAGNPDLAAARARIGQARAALAVEKAGSKPSVSAMGVAAHVRIPDLGGGSQEGDTATTEQSGGTTSTNIFNLGLNAAWEIDLFGGQRRKDEASRAELAGAEASAQDARVSLTSAVASAYLEYRDRQQRLDLAQAAVKQRKELADFARQRFELGAGTSVEVERAHSALEQARQQVAPLKAQADSYANALAILAGEVPGAVDPLLERPAAIPLPPASIAVGNPADLIQRRPDIRVAERRLAAETARIGVAEAARFPRLSFMGILGIGGSRVEDLTHLDDFTAIAAPMLQWNVLDFGKAKAQVGQAEARRDQAEAMYRGTVLGALRDVEDALAAFRASRETVASLARAEASAARIEELERQRFDLGASGKPAYLEAELAHNAAQQSLTQARAQLTIDFITLQKALGLGWSEAN